MKFWVTDKDNLINALEKELKYYKKKTNEYKFKLEKIYKMETIEDIKHYIFLETDVNVE